MKSTHMSPTGFNSIRINRVSWVSEADLRNLRLTMRHINAIIIIVIMRPAYISTYHLLSREVPIHNLLIADADRHNESIKL